MARRLVFLAVLLLFFFVLSVSAHGGGAHDDDDDSDSNSGSSEKPNLRSRSLILVKIWCLIIVFVGTFVGGISPYFLNWNEGFLVTGTHFAGGVFLGTAMMHFLSDSNETFHQLTDNEYPFAFMLSTVGYLLTMFADSVIYFVYAKQSTNLSSNTSDLELQGNSAQDREERTHTEPHLSKAAATATMANVSSIGDSILLIFALCFHSVFEGIAIGVAETKADAWRALWTVCLHKIFAAIAMGIALLRMIPDRPLLSTVAYAFAFAISSPIGVGIGIVIDATTQGVVADWVYAISMGLASGVFVYVSINHLLSKNYNNTNHQQQQNPKVSADQQQPHYKFLAVLLGISVIAVVMIWD